MLSIDTWSAPAAARHWVARARAQARARGRAARPAQAPRSPWARAGASRPRASARRRGPPPRPPSPLAHGARRRRLIGPKRAHSAFDPGK